MRCYIKILNPDQAHLGFSYGTFRFCKYGVCVWEYKDEKLTGDELWCGAVEFINQPLFVTEPKMEGASGCRVWLRPGLNAVKKMAPSPLPDIPVAVINNVVTSLITGVGLPLKIR